MNAERLHAVTRSVHRELDSKDILIHLETLVDALEALSKQSNPNTQQGVAAARDSFYESVTDVPSDFFTPAWRQILVEIGIENLLGKNLKERTRQVIAENLMTPQLAGEELRKILDRLTKWPLRLKS